MRYLWIGFMVLLAFVSSSALTGAVVLCSDGSGCSEGTCIDGICSLAACGDLRGTGSTCVDGNLLDGDGCSSSCVAEDGWICTEQGCHSSKDKAWQDVQVLVNGYEARAFTVSQFLSQLEDIVRRFVQNQ